MSSHTRVALVTGANKGIGFAIVRDLCRQFSGDVVLTARDEARGQAAVQRLQAEGLSPRFHLLDIDDLQSIRAMRDFLRKEYGGLDVLVNNAGIAFKTNDPTPFHIQAEVTMKTNFFGTRDVCTELLPLMKPQGRCDKGPRQWCFWNDLAAASMTSSTGPAPSPCSATPASLLCPHLDRCPSPQDSVHTCPGLSSALCPTGLSQLASPSPLYLHSKLSSQRPFSGSVSSQVHFPGDFFLDSSFSLSPPLSGFIQASGLFPIQTC
uniref:Carbonyl reductase 1 n=1 Tax=Felis catus TaxID=9685 RepID=A0ABI8AGE4_FELCA